MLLHSDLRHCAHAISPVK